MSQQTKPTDNEQSIPLVMPLDDWEQLGQETWGDDRDKWEFVCPLCGNEQSVESVMDRNPELDIHDVREWIYHCCEGRFSDSVDCDWPLGWIEEECGVILRDGDETSRCFAFPDRVLSELSQ